MIEYLSDTIDPILDGDGIFEAIRRNNGDNFAGITSETAVNDDIEYYYNHSGQKRISPMYRKFIALQTDGKINSALDSMAAVALSKFKDKWVKTYNALLTEYKPLENYSMIEEETPNLIHTETPNIKHSIDRSVNSKVSTTSSNDIYGFNRDEDAVPANSAKTTTEGDSNDNKEITSDVESGTRVNSDTGNRKLERSGNIGVTTSQQMLKEEIDVRAYILLNEMFKDLDTLMVNPLY